MEEIKYKYFAWGYEKSYMDQVLEEMKKREIPCICESNLGRYFLSVPNDYYRNALDIIRKIGDESRIGSINYYDKIRPLKSYSIAYAYLEDANILNKNLGDEFYQPKNIKKIIKKLKEICGCDVKIFVNSSDAAIEIITTENLNNRSRIKEAVCDFLSDNNFVKFKEVYMCYPEGEIINPTPEEMLRIEGIYRLFDSSFFAYSMYEPERAHLVSKENKERRNSWSQNWGFNNDIKFIEEDKGDKIVIMGETTLHEYKFYNYAGEAINCVSKNFLSFETKLIDNLNYSLTIILSDNMVAKITTEYKDKREVSSTRKLPLGAKFPDLQSTRDGFLSFPKENGEYEGILEEYYMKSTDGNKLLHYCTHSPFFEVYDIPSDFDFINNNQALKKVQVFMIFVIMILKIQISK